MVCALHWKHFIYKMRQLVLTFFSIYINYLEDDLSSNPNCLLTIHLFFQLYVTKCHSQRPQWWLTEDTCLGLSMKNELQSWWSKASTGGIMRKYTKTSHPVLLFNKNLFQESSSKKHFGMNLNRKQNFEDHLKTIFTKVNKTIGLLWKL